MGRIRDLMTPVSFRVRAILKCHPYDPEKQVSTGGLTSEPTCSILNGQASTTPAIKHRENR